MPLTQPMNSNLIDRNDIQAKHGIFRNRGLHVPAPIVRSKLSKNTVPTKPNRNKFQSKIPNRCDQTTTNDLKVKLSQLLEADERNVVRTPSIQLMQDNYLSNVPEASDFGLGQSDQSILLLVERCKLDQTTISVSRKSLPNVDSSVKLGKDAISSIIPRERTSSVEAVPENESTISNTNDHISPSVDACIFDVNYFNQPIHRKSTTFIKDDVENLSTKKFAVNHMEVRNETKTLTTSTVNDLNIGDTSQVLLEDSRVDLLETELKTYSESLKKYDQEAKDVIDKFTESLNEKGNIIRKYEEELSLFNDKVSQLQTQLVESLERTKQMESVAVKTPISQPTIDLKSENEKLKGFVELLEKKLAKRDLHIYNLKEVLTIETKKIKELNKAQEEINNLQRVNIDKCREISVLRDELKYAAKMRLELANEYEGKIVKLKKLLAIREYLLIKGKS